MDDGRLVEASTGDWANAAAIVTLRNIRVDGLPEAELPSSCSPGKQNHRMHHFRYDFSARGWVSLKFIVVLLSGCLARPLAADAPSPALTEAIRQARIVLAKDAAKVPGLAVAVAHEGKIVWSEGFGYADL